MRERIRGREKEQTLGGEEKGRERRKRGNTWRETQWDVKRRTEREREEEGWGGREIHRQNKGWRERRQVMGGEENEDGEREEGEEGWGRERERGGG